METAVFFETPVEICARVFRELRPRTPLPAIDVKFRPYANANSFVKMEESRLEFRVSDVLEQAPAPIFEALAFILIGKLFRKPVAVEYGHRYRRYLNRRDVRHAIETARQNRGRKQVAAPQGRTYDLELLFDELNFKYFFGLMSRPALGWSLRISNATLGHYDPSHHTIVLNKVLDRPEVPRLAVEYVLYHEILHIKYPAQHNGLRRCVHTREFKDAEKKFERLAEAKALLKKL